MARLLSPDDACISVDVPTNRGTARYDGRTVDVTSPSHIRVLKAAGYTVGDVSGQPPKSAGRRCTSCGFNGWFITCSRCGGSCERN